MAERITIDDVYEIAAEVAEETVTKFLKNLVRLVPAAEDIVESIKDSQYEELQNYRRAAGVPQAEAPKRTKPILTVEDLTDDVDNEFRDIAKPAKLTESYDFDDVLAAVPLERSNLRDQARGDMM